VWVQGIEKIEWGEGKDANRILEAHHELSYEMNVLQGEREVRGSNLDGRTVETKKSTRAEKKGPNYFWLKNERRRRKTSRIVHYTL